MLLANSKLPSLKDWNRKIKGKCQASSQETSTCSHGDQECGSTSLTEPSRLQLDATISHHEISQSQPMEETPASIDNSGSTTFDLSQPNQPGRLDLHEISSDSSHRLCNGSFSMNWPAGPPPPDPWAVGYVNSHNPYRDLPVGFGYDFASESPHYVRSQGGLEFGNTFVQDPGIFSSFNQWLDHNEMGI